MRTIPPELLTPTNIEGLIYVAFCAVEVEDSSPDVQVLYDILVESDRLTHYKLYTRLPISDRAHQWWSKLTACGHRNRWIFQMLDPLLPECPIQ